MSKLSLLLIALLDGKTIMCEKLFIDFPIHINRNEFLAELFKFGLTDFDIILGMDWLAKYQAQINCPKQKITLRGPRKEKGVHKGKSLKCGVKLITVIKA